MQNWQQQVTARPVGMPSNREPPFQFDVPLAA
jgi:hypothetical protein